VYKPVGIACDQEPGEVGEKALEMSIVSGGVNNEGGMGERRRVG